MFAIGGENVEGIGLAEACWVQVSAEGLLVGEHNDDFLVRRGWGFSFQNSVNPGPRRVVGQSEFVTYRVTDQKKFRLPRYPRMRSGFV